MKFLSLVLLSAFAQPFGIEDLPMEKIPAMMRDTSFSCNLVHVWAIWCPHCLEETEGLLQYYASLKSVRPIVIDISSPFQQRTYSKKLMQSWEPKFTTYVMPTTDSEKYRKAIDTQWDGSLPFTLLQYKLSKSAKWEQKRWLGASKQNQLEIEQAIQAHCGK